MTTPAQAACEAAMELQQFLPPGSPHNFDERTERLAAIILKHIEPLLAAERERAEKLHDYAAELRAECEAVRNAEPFVVNGDARCRACDEFLPDHYSDCPHAKPLPEVPK